MGAGDALRMHYYFPGMIVGIILLQTSIVAPTLFKKLNIEDFGRAIRALWPKFFIMLAILGGASLVSLYFEHDPTIPQYAISGSTTLFALICYAIIPATNPLRLLYFLLISPIRGSTNEAIIIVDTANTSGKTPSS
mgnify:CR=1 FL=1